MLTRKQVLEAEDTWWEKERISDKHKRISSLTNYIGEWTELEAIKHMKFPIRHGISAALRKDRLGAHIFLKWLQQWLWILEDPLWADIDDTAGATPIRDRGSYGMSYFMAAATKYSLPTPPIKMRTTRRVALHGGIYPME